MKSRATARASTTKTRALEQGRDAFRKQEWGAAFSHLSAADREEALDPEHLVELAQAAMLIGKDAEGAEILARAHQGFMGRGDIQLAARSAFWLGFTSLINGEEAKASGWLARSNRLLEGCDDCVE